MTDAEATLRTLCGVLGIEFTPRMLSWPAGPKSCDGCWAPWWYKATHESTGTLVVVVYVYSGGVECV